MEKQTEPMDASKQFCPNEACSARGQIGEGNIRIHSYRPQRYRCQRCKKTFSARRGTMMEGLRTPAELVMRVIILLAYGCPYLKQYQTGGIEALKVLQFHRPESRLEAHRDTIEAYFQEHPATTIPEAVKRIEDLTGLKRSPTQVGIFLKKLGLKRLKTSGVPAKCDVQQQESFKKTNWSRV